MDDIVKEIQAKIADTGIRSDRENRLFDQAKSVSKSKSSMSREEAIKAIFMADYEQMHKQLEMEKTGLADKTAVVQIKSDTNGMVHVKISGNGGKTWVNRSL